MFGQRETHTPWVTNSVRPELEPKRKIRKHINSSVCQSYKWQMRVREDGELYCEDCERLQANPIPCLRCKQLFKRGCRVSRVCISCFFINQTKDD